LFESVRRGRCAYAKQHKHNKINARENMYRNRDIEWLSAIFFINLQCEKACKYTFILSLLQIIKV